MTGIAKATVHIGNDRVIVTEYPFAPEENTGWHRHGHGDVEGDGMMERTTDYAFIEIELK